MQVMNHTLHGLAAVLFIGCRSSVGSRLLCKSAGVTEG